MTVRHRSTGLAFATVIVVMALSGALAWACSPSARLDPVRSPEGFPGTTETVVGWNFYKLPVQIYLVSQSGHRVLLGSDIGPDFSESVTIPAGTPPGTYTIGGEAVKDGQTFWAPQPYEVLGPDEDAPGEEPVTPSGNDEGGAPPAPPQPGARLPEGAVPLPALPGAGAGEADIARGGATATPPGARRSAVDPRAGGAAGGSSPPSAAAALPQQPGAQSSGSAPEADLRPSPRSSASDLWSGFGGPTAGTGSESGPSLEGPAPSSAHGVPVLGLSVLSLGTLALLAASAVSTRGRRRRVAATAPGAPES